MINQICFYTLIITTGLSIVLFLISRLVREKEDSSSEELQSFQAGYVIRGYAKTGDFIGLVIYWLRHGIIGVEVLSDRSIAFEQFISLGKGVSEAEKNLLNALFKGKKKITLSAFPEDFRKSIRSLRIDVERTCEQKGSRVFTRFSMMVKNISAIFIYVAWGILIYTCLPRDTMVEFIQVYTVIFITIAPLRLSLNFLRWMYEQLSIISWRLILAIACMILLIGFMIGFNILAKAMNPELHQLADCGLIALCIQSFVYLFSKKKTIKGKLWLREIRDIIKEIKAVETVGDKGFVRAVFL